MSDAQIGFDTKFERGNGADPEVFAELGEVINLSAPGISRETKDATHFQSPEKWREFIKGLLDAGEFSVEIHFDPDGPTAAQMMADIIEDGPITYRITFPDNTEWEFSALATGFEPGVPMDDKMTATFTGKLTGKPAFVD
ncbi:phage tail tube protein [uncultured Pelagimonas sp.]|uniref:phage tail tube protein n=1 Tax=uncultured Pelagimonas sp. TaxID=1618102 RepID=UPI0026081D55|nr:phage tail tube protein [uncultured Pelagimonas sp.]